MQGSVFHRFWSAWKSPGLTLRDKGVLFIFGLLSALAFAPFGLWPVWFFLFPLLLRKLDQQTEKFQVFQIGWWFGWGHFLSGLYWVSFALLVDWNSNFIFLPATLILMPAVLAVFLGLATLAAFLTSSSGWSRWVSFAGWFCVLEWVRGYSTDFPWNLMAYVWGDFPAGMQLTSVVGPHGLSVLVFLLLSWTYLFSFSRLKTLKYSVPTVALLALAWGQWRVSTAPEAFVPGPWVRIAQPNIPQKERRDRGKWPTHLRTLLSLTKQSSVYPITHMIFPEAAWPVRICEKGLTEWPAFLDPNRMTFVGAARVQRKDGKVYQIWNSLWMLNPDGSPRDAYDKHNLFPFAEYMPLRSLLNATLPSLVEKITGGALLDFSSGNRPEPRYVPGAPPAKMLICYDTVFPQTAFSMGDVRPGWIINVTNDAWFGGTTGPYQHFAAARFRAVEQGLPLVRAGNTGISAVFDPYGRVLHKLSLNETGVLDFSLPQSTLQPPLYTQIGDIAFWILSVLLIGVGYWGRSPGPTAQPRPRFYGRRVGRKLNAFQASLVKTVLPNLAFAPSQLSRGVHALFPSEVTEIWLEIGLGSGEHMVQQLAENPHVGFISCEPFLNGIVHLLQSLPIAHRSRVRLFHDDVRLLWPHFPSQSIHKAFVLFPDPWPKARHRKRRLVDSSLRSELARVLKPQGEVYLGSDHGPYVEQMFHLFSHDPGWVQVQGIPSPDPVTWPPFPQTWPLTRYRQKAERKGIPCAHMVFSLGSR